MPISRRILKRTALVAVLLCLVLLLIFNLTPYLCNHYLLPQLVEKLPFSQHSLQIDSISPWKLTGQLTIADENNNVSLPKLELHYSIFSLINGELKKAIINGLSVHLQLHNGQLVFPQLDKPKKSAPIPAKKNPKRSFTVKKILLKNCTILVENDNKPFHSTLLVNGELTTYQQASSRKFTGELTVRGDIPARLDFSGNLNQTEPSIQIQLKLPELNRMQDYFSSSLRLSGSADLALDIRLTPAYTLKDYEIFLKCPNAQIRLGKMAISSKKENFLSAEIKGDSAKASFAIKNLQLNSPERLYTDITGEIIPSKKIKGYATISTPYSTIPLTSNFTLVKKDNGKHFQLKLFGKKLQIKEINLENANVETTAFIKDGRTTGEIRVDFPLFTLRETTVSKTSLTLPFQFPLKEVEPGKLTVSAIKYENITLGKISGKITQTAAGLKTNLLFTSSMPNDFQIHCKGELNSTLATVTTDCQLPPTYFESSRLPEHPALNPTFSFSGKIGANSNISFTENRITGFVNLSIAEGSFLQEKTTLTGIHTSITIPDINIIQSSPDQQLTIENLSFNDIRANNAKIRWQLESPHSLLVENAQLEWCDGKIETASFRITTDKKELATTLYCDRLRLSKLLEQFDLAETSGTATLNGRLPIILNNQGIDIDNGFLFSTPGEQGVISFSNTGKIRDSIPGANTSSYITYALESLKSFAYNWIKLTFNSEQDELLIKMELDGKPEKPLPYRYENGKIVQLPRKSEKGEGLQHPVYFDVKFHLPLKQMFQYGTGIQSAINKIKESF